MPRPIGTRPFHNRVALVFDFDGTLAPDTLDVLLDHAGIDPGKFRRERMDPLVDDGWDLLLALYYALIKAGRAGEIELTREWIQEVGRAARPFDGVPEMFQAVRRCARSIVEDMDVEFYLLTCGLLDVHREMEIAQEFEAMWGSRFHFDEDGRAEFVAEIVTHPEKVRYVTALAKGLPPAGPHAPEDVYRDVPEEKWRVPFDQIIYLGDGLSDMPTFELMNEHGGIALGVVNEDHVKDWHGYKEMSARRRVQNLARADYSEGSELMRSIMLSVESICKLIALRRLGRGE